jgi:predicted nucleotidyltransferase
MWSIYGLSTMARLRFPADLREFLKLLNSARVEYLLIGGYAVAYYGYPRATANLDIWVDVSDTNARKLVRVLQNFGFDVPDLGEGLFRESGRISEPPLRIEILTTISGVSFDACFLRRARVRFDSLQVNLISLSDLMKNKAASGRPKDLDDLRALEG